MVVHIKEYYSAIKKEIKSVCIDMEMSPNRFDLKSK